MSAADSNIALLHTLGFSVKLVMSSPMGLVTTLYSSISASDTPSKVKIKNAKLTGRAERLCSALSFVCGGPNFDANRTKLLRSGQVLHCALSDKLCRGGCFLLAGNEDEQPRETSRSSQRGTRRLKFLQAS